MSKIGLLFFAACTPTEPDMKVVVSVKELKKGTLFLEKVQDSLLVIIDSAQVAREEAVTLTADLDHAELFYLTLNKNGAKTFPRDLLKVKTSLTLSYIVSCCGLERLDNYNVSKPSNNPYVSLHFIDNVFSSVF